MMEGKIRLVKLVWKGNPAASIAAMCLSVADGEASVLILSCGVSVGEGRDGDLCAGVPRIGECRWVGVCDPNGTEHLTYVPVHSILTYPMDASTATSTSSLLGWAPEAGSRTAGIVGAAAGIVCLLGVMGVLGRWGGTGKRRRDPSKNNGHVVAVFVPAMIRWVCLPAAAASTEF